MKKKDKKEYYKIYSKEHRTERIEYKKLWALNNQDKIKRYYLKNKEEYTKRSKKHHEIHQKENNERRRWNKIKYSYGIDQIKYNELLSKQNGVCAICLQKSTRSRSGKVWPLSVDHDHKTGRVRGLLCNNCNSMLGYSKDSLFTLDQAKKYLLLVN